MSCPNPVSELLFTDKILDSTGGYIKTVCAINILDGQIRGLKYCEKYGMHLYIIDSNQTQNELFRVTADHLRKPSNALWISGTSRPGMWVYDSYIPLYSQLRLKDASYPVNVGLSLISIGGKYQLDGKTQGIQQWYICEIK